MKRLVFIIGAVFFASILWLGCGGGGSDGGGAGDLQGTWFGVIEDDEGEAEEFSLQLDASGNIVDMEIGGSSIYDTGHLNEDWDENLFYFRYDYMVGHNNPFISSIIIVDDSAQCAIFSDSEQFFAVLEKGVASLPAYTVSDIVGSYTGGGYEFAYDPLDDIWTWGGEAVNMTVNNPDLDFTGNTSSDSFTGGFDSTLLHGATYGGYSGTLTRDTGIPKDLNINALVSPGKNCVAAWAWKTGTSPTSNEDFILIGLVK